MLSEKDLVQKVKMLIITIRKKKKKTQNISINQETRKSSFHACDDSRAQQEEPSPGTTQSMESHGLC